MSGLRRSSAHPGIHAQNSEDLTFCYGISWHGVAFAMPLLSVLWPQGWQE